MSTDKAVLAILPERIIGCGFAVSNAPGAGFVETVYENALAHQLREAGLTVRQQHAAKVCFDGVIVGEYVTDLMVEEAAIVELKAVKALGDIHRAQCLNYLKATGLPLCRLLNFGRPCLEVRRLVL